MAIDGNELKPQLRVGAAILALALIAWTGSNVIVNRAIKRGRERIDRLEAKLVDLNRTKEELATLREGVSAEAIAKEKDQVSRLLLAPAAAHSLVERVREVCRVYAAPPFEPTSKVRELAPVVLDAGAKRWKLPIEVTLETEWEKLGPLLAELRAIPGILVIEDASFRRDFPRVEVKLVLAACYGEGGT